MVALFLVLTVAFFLVLDVVLAARRQSGLAAAVARQANAEDTRSTTVAGFELMPDRSYHPGHTWAKFRDTALTRVGADEFAARLIGPADGIQMPEPGTTVRAGRPLVTVTRRGRTATLLSPVTGIVQAVNHDVEDDPATLARAPYGAGWLVEIKGDDVRSDLRMLEFGETARQWMDQTVGALHQMVTPGMAMAAADGGRPVDAIGDQLDEATWNQARQRFLLNAE